MSKRDSVIQTNDDAASSKHSAVTLGYYSDPFISKFISKPVRRPPLINRGYTARVLVLESIIRTFCTCGKRSVPPVPLQIVSLGAGFDTTFWKMKARAELEGVIKYVEIDFPEVVKKKVSIITSQKDLHEGLDYSSTTTSMHGGIYHLMAGDITKKEDMEAIIRDSQLDRSLPTLFICECVLAYLPPDQGTDVLRWVADRFPTCGFVSYDPISPHDPFGKVMIKNLTDKGCPMLSMDAYPDIPSHKSRYEGVGWNRVEALDMLALFDHYLPQDVLTRIKRVEMMDELEEWFLIQTHYMYVWAMKEPAGAPAPFWGPVSFEACAKGKPQPKIPSSSFMM
eukprot:TRINITY_DN12687_c0_g1_i1.p1 TRINITY_DN12687_c0_g1~~TRINITY_DN12687_c0_g1_i1.p1  ORF type:complete len:354 (+),score=71.03 TRINITY_DN12687_c0_g1_i1:51-1064(+)